MCRYLYSELSKNSVKVISEKCNCIGPNVFDSTVYLVEIFLWVYTAFWLSLAFIVFLILLKCIFLGNIKQLVMLCRIITYLRNVHIGPH